MSLENKLNNQEQEISLAKRVKAGVRNYLIDTSAKVCFYAPIMAAMEAHNGLDGEQILQSRATAALIDSAVARVYTKTADYLSKKSHVDLKKGGIKGWVLDTAAMVGVYTPIYAGILVSSGADAKQIAYSLTMGAIIASITSRPFRKYALVPWRKLCGHTQNSIKPS